MKDLTRRLIDHADTDFASVLRRAMADWDAATPEQRETALAAAKKLADAAEAGP